VTVVDVTGVVTGVVDGEVAGVVAGVGSAGLEASVDDSRHDVITIAMSIEIRALLA
jgi:hypothetical protein